MGIHETQVDYWVIMRMIETFGDSRDSKRLQETHETQRVSWRIIRLRETTWVS